MSLRRLILDRIRDAGPITAAEFMRVALYEPSLGYYARRPQRSGRAGDFYTSVDVGPLFGSLLAVQIDQMWRLMGSPRPVTIVEAGAGNGRLARDILDELSSTAPDLYEALQLELVERSEAARATQAEILGPHADRLVRAGDDLAASMTGILYCNELLDAMPTHVVVMTAEGLHEVHVAEEGGRLVERLATPSTPELTRYLERLDIRLQPGWRAEINLDAVDWLRDAMHRLQRGFAIVVDYGHEARRLYSEAHASGTLATFHRHTKDAGPSAAGPRADAGWLATPGEQDLTAHVDFTSLRLAAEAEGATTLGLLDQTYFLLGLGIADRLRPSSADSTRDVRQRMATRSLVMPGGLGSTHKVLLLGKGVGRPQLLGCTAGSRLT